MRTGALVVCLLALLAGANATTYTSGGSCTAVANAQKESYAKDACLTAIAVAVNKGCSATQGNTLIHDFTGIFRDSAFAVARVATSAFAQCSTYGNAFGCAAGKAQAMKFAHAQFDLFAGAFAQAINKCKKCDPRADASITTQMLIEIVAGAFAKVEAGVCVGPNQTARAVAVERCTAIVIADGFARACAKALIAGNCMSQTAIAQVNAKLKVETNQYCACRGYKWTNGGWVRNYGETYCYDWQSA